MFAGIATTLGVPTEAAGVTGVASLRATRTGGAGLMVGVTPR